MATRDGFGRGLIELGKRNKDVVVLSADLTDSVRASWFKEQFPDRFFCVGVAEQNMMGMASGLALSGKIVFACTFGVFASGRAWEQIRVSISYMGLNVKIVGTHGGISVGEDGYTHQAIEEITVMRALPHMTIIIPADALEAEKATIASAEYEGPVYLRLGRPKVPVVSKKEEPFLIGKGVLLEDGSDVAILACGQLVYEALEAAKALKKDGVSARVVNIHTPQPLDEDIVIKAAKETGAIVTAEEHVVHGGLGSAVAETVATRHPVPIEMVGIKGVCSESGSPKELFEKYGLTSKYIAQAVTKVIKRKTRTL